MFMTIATQRDAGAEFQRPIAAAESERERERVREGGGGQPTGDHVALFVLAHSSNWHAYL